MNEMSLSNKKDLIRKLFLAGIRSVRPERLVKSKLKIKDDILKCGKLEHDLKAGKCYLLGFGKAVAGMAFEAERILNGRLEKGIISVPTDLSISPPTFSKIEIFHGAKNNLPDEDSLKATERIIEVAKCAGKNDLVLLMISGGGSALLSKTISGIELTEKVSLIKKLSQAGANIKELNAVRKKLSDVKGGKLANYIYPSHSISLVLSDIVNDPLDLIASGPTVFDEEQASVALNILKKYEINDLNYLNIILNHVPLNNDIFQNVNNIIIGNNAMALEETATTANENGYRTVILSHSIESNVEQLSKLYGKLVNLLMDKEKIDFDLLKDVLKELKVNDKQAVELKTALDSKWKKLCLLFGGETVVNVRGSGLGGRNQELALRLSTEFKKNSNFDKDCGVVFLSGGTDGIDGPTDAAGAITYSFQFLSALDQGLDPTKYLENNDSYNYFNKLNCGDDHVITGHTGVNVMDLHILLLHFPK